MNAQTLKEAMRLAKAQKHNFDATADRGARPHVAAAGELTLMGPDRVAVSEWFCPVTVRNLADNQRVALVIWDPDADAGYQLLGAAEKVEDVAFIDGGPQPDELRHPGPQVERKVTVHVDAVYAFTHAPHDDEEI
jgi:predicted pyridoxine 5'-phosphate oxidase superfamily flavin-nucleotide-binding protein